MKLFFLTALFVLQSGQAFARSEINLTIDNMKFVPATIKAKVGQVLIWKNKDLFPHTVTANDGSFDSGVINPGGTWKYKVKKAGLMDYKCTLHPPMVGSINVSI